MLGGDFMIPVLDLARYIVNYSNKKNYSISNLKLQKLLYFVQAYYLAFTPSHEPCFSDEIEAWDFGPVVPCVYREFKSFGGGDIPTVTSSYRLKIENNFWSVQAEPFDEDCIDKKDRKIINSVVDNFGSYSASELVQLTHRQTPWKEAYKNRKKNAIITKESIWRYFDAE